MKIIDKTSAIRTLIATLVLGLGAVILSSNPAARAAQPPVYLNTAAPFAILSGTPNITDAGNASVINGNVGLSPATGAGIGLLCSQVTGTIYSVDAAGPLPCRVTDGPLLVTAKNDLTAAYIDAAGRTPVATVPTELGGTTKTAGVYASNATTFQITAGAGPLVIDAEGDPNAVFIFEMDFAGTGLTVGPGSVVSLVNGAQACNIFWRVDTAAINTTATFKGNILALNSITVANGSNIEGRLLARNGNVTLINDTITVPTCTTPTATPVTPSSGGSGSGSTAVVPKLPNTGVQEDTTNRAWLVLVPASLSAVGAAFYIVRKRRAARI